MVPAQQRLEAGDGAILEPHDRLEEHLDLAALQRAAQIRLQRQPVGALRAHRRAEHFDAIAADALGVAHGDLGVLQHVARRRGASAGSNKRDADRGEQADLAVGEAHRRRQRAAHGIGQRDHMIGVGFGDENDRESVAGEARQRVLRLQQPRQPMRDGQQNAVARGDADLLVDLLEAVDVDARAPSAARPSPCARRPAPPSSRSKNNSRLGRPVRLSWTASCSRRSCALRSSVTSVSVPTTRMTSPSGPTTGPRAQTIAEIMAVRGAQAEFLIDAAAPLLQHRVETGAVAVLLERMQQIEPGGGGALEPAAVEAQLRLRLGADDRYGRRARPSRRRSHRRRSAPAPCARRR